MTSPAPIDWLKATLDPIRLAVVGAAAAGRVEIIELAGAMDVSRKDVAAAVGALRALGVLDDDARLDRVALRSIARALPDDGSRRGEPVDGPWTAEEAVTIGRFFDAGRLVEVPKSHRKRRLVLEKVALEFEPGRRYPERDVNFMIQLIHPDYAAVRRYLVDEGFLDRADGVYWRIGGRYDAPEVDRGGDEGERRPISVIDGVELRPYTWTMLDQLAERANDPRISRFMSDGFPHPYTRDDAESWIEVATTSAAATQFAVFVDGRLSGGVGAFPLKGEQTGMAEIGWWLHPDLWGHGITSACVRVLVDELFERHGLMRLWAPVMRPNVASARVAERAGLSLEGVARSAYLKDGVRYDQLNYGITRSEWRAGR